jgi:hypothetical membrane protein
MRALLACGLVAGPLYVVLVGLQVLTRDGFDLTRHPASVLSNGDLGWVQTTTFAVTGLLFLGFAAGLHLAGPAGRWGPRLIGLLGVGMVGAAAFPADPVDGFPPGTPLGPPTTVSGPGLAHFLVGTIAFVALMAACFVFGRRAGAAGERGWARTSTAIGAFFVLSWLLLFVLPGVAVVNIVLSLALAVALVWTALLARRQLVAALATTAA